MCGTLVGMSVFSMRSELTAMVVRWVVVLSVLGVVDTICVGVCMVHPQSGLYCGRLSVCNSYEPSVCVVTSD